MSREEHDAAFRSSRRAVLQSAGAMAALAGFGVGPARSVTAATAQEATPSVESDSVLVYPPHGTQTASPYTEISFRGTTAEELGPLKIVGSESGGHSGVFASHGDGNGVSFLLDARFEPGEEVTVEAVDSAIEFSGVDGVYSFTVCAPAPLTPAPDSSVNDDPEEEPRVYRSRPDLVTPNFTITDNEGSLADGLIFLTSNVAQGPKGLTILDNTGEVVWFQPPRVETESVYDLRVQEYQGEPVITWAEAASPRGYGYGHYVIANSAYERIAEVQVGNRLPGGDVHEFLLTPRGTVLVILYHPIQWDARVVGGLFEDSVIDNIIQEIEIETGRVLFEWHTLDHIDIAETQRTRNVDEGRALDYAHVNSVNEDPDGNLIISARHTYANYLIDRTTNEVIWRMGGKESDFEMGEGLEFAWQHDARIPEPGRMTLFDNAEADQELDSTRWSRGMIIEFDDEAMTATLVQELVHPTEILSISQGNMQTLSNGNYFIGWGSAPVFTEFSPEGEVLFNGRFPTGGNSYRAYRYPWIGQPTTPPNIAAERDGDGNVTVYASWNGSTEVASWRVLGGPSPSNLTVVGSEQRSGFETEIPVETDAALVSVEALDADGNILGAAAPIETGV